MSDDDDFGDLDLPSESSESESISDVNPDEMAKLMADLDDMDDDVFKSGTKTKTTTTPTTQSDNDNKKSALPNVKKESKIDDDWDDDADDLLDSSNNSPVKQRPKTEKFSKQDSEDKIELRIDPEVIKQSPKKEKYQVASDLLEKTSTVDEREDITKKTSQILKKPVENLQVSPKRDKRKVISDLFDESESAENKAEKQIKPDKKDSREVRFDDDSDPLDMGTKSKSSDSGFMDTLLGKSSLSKPSRKHSVEFNLPDDYKGTENNRKSNSSQKQKSSETFEDFFGDTDSRPRRQAGRRNKSFIFDDDDILGSDKDKPKKPSMNDTDKSKPPSRKPPKDDWLFGPPKSPPKEEEEEDRKKESRASTSSSPKKEDWLNQMLTTTKTSPARSQNVKSTSQATTDSNQGVSNASIGTSHQGSATPVTKPLMEAVTNLSPAYNTILQCQLAEQQSKIQADVVAMTSLLQAQQQRAEAELFTQLQVQMQEQQQRFDILMSQHNQKALSSGSTKPNLMNIAVEDEESIKQLKIDLHKAQTEVGRLEAELSLFKDHHEKELNIIRESQLKRESLEQEIWNRKLENAAQEKNALIEKFQSKIDEMKVEKEDLAKSYETRLSELRTEMADTLQRSKEMHEAVIERMKKEHKSASERVNELKEIEIKAALEATGRVKEAEAVLSQLESNTNDLSGLTKVINEKHESALEFTKKSLQMKEKQLKDMENNLNVIKAESESERNRLTMLVNRLEASLANQGTEIESSKWTLAQEKMKIDTEKASLMEEKRHFQLNMENERRELERNKEYLLREQQILMQTIARQKSQMLELENKMPKPNISLSTTLEARQLKEDRKVLEEKKLDLKYKKQEIMEEEKELEEKKYKLEKEHSKNCEMKELLEQKSIELEQRGRDLETREKRLNENQKELETKLSEITFATQNLHKLQDAISKERLGLEMEREADKARLIQNLCYACLSKFRIDSNARPQQTLLSRITGDEKEIFNIPRRENTPMKSFDAASVLQRLKAAREEEFRIKAKREELKTQKYSHTVT